MDSNVEEILNRIRSKLKDFDSLEKSIRQTILERKAKRAEWWIKHNQWKLDHKIN